MKKLVYAVLAALLLIPGGNALAQGKNGKSYVIGFYKLTNLFDTYQDEGKNDYESPPDGANERTDAKYA